MSRLKKNSQHGFTLAEIVIVCAIAALIMLLIFLAISGAQKSRRDDQRRKDLPKLAAALENYATNHSGQYPADQPSFGAAMGIYAPHNLYDPSSGQPYDFTSTSLNHPDGSHSAAVTYVSANNQRVYNICMSLESNNAGYCVSNK